MHNNLVLNNTKAGIMLHGFCSGNILHNTIVGNGFGSPYDQGGAGLAIGPFNNEKAQNNIVVSNKGGMNSLQDSNSKNNHNLVWGNVDNYVGDAQTGAGDLSVDPMFVDPGNKDYRLQAGSPAIDTGAAWGLTTDFDGNERPAGAAPDLGAFEFQPAGEGGDLLINEVMSNPLVESTGEFVELFNPTDSPVDAAGLTLDDGDATDDILGWQGGDTMVPAGGYAVILDTGYAEQYEIPAEAILLTVPNASLGSGLSKNDPITITRDSAVVSTYAHPFDPGNGLSAERVDHEADDTADNWVPSPCGSSPGKANCISAGGAPQGLPTLVITEVMAVPVVATTGEYIEVYNYGDEPVELLGLSLSDGDSNDVIVEMQGKESLLPAGEHGLIMDVDIKDSMDGPPYSLGAVQYIVTVGNSTLGNGLAKSDPISILAADGLTVAATFTPLVTPSSGQSVERVDLEEGDIAGNWMPCPCPEQHSAGLPNCAYGGSGQVETPALIINEVMANPLDEDKGEFIELYNPGDEPVDAAGLVFSDGDSTDVIGAFEVGGSTLIQAKGYGIILDPEYEGGYSIPEGHPLLKPENTTLGNGLANNDPITLFATDGLTELSSMSHPFNAGNGISMERKGNLGDVAENWTASTCPTGSSPGHNNCAGGGEAPPPPDPVEDCGLTISEVMANPLVEKSEEFVEVVNTGDKAVDVAGYVLTDGDATDTLEGFDGGPTEIPSGGYAVVLDRDYPADGPYQIPADAVLLTTDDKTVGSGLANDDPVTLLAADGATVLSTFLYPFNAGNGTSVERINLDAADTPENWSVSTCDSGSSPGAVNCSAGEPTQPGITVVDINTAVSSELQQVNGIGESTANKIVNYRNANGPYDSLLHLCVLDNVTPSKTTEWSVAEEGENPYVIGLEGAKEIHVFTDLGQLFAAVPDAADPGAATWDGILVKVYRVAALTQDDSEDNQELMFGQWADQDSYEPAGGAEIAVFLDKAPGEASYVRGQTDLVDAMSDWIKEDGDPYGLPNFYRWAGTLYGWGKMPYGHVFAIEGLLEIEDGSWRIRIRAKADAGVDRLVIIERWLAAASWKSLKVIWSYNYKPVIVEAVNGYTKTLPYRLAKAHPCRQFWYDKYGEVVEVPKCQSFGECGGGIGTSYTWFDEALVEWKETPVDPGTGYCFTYNSKEYCFTVDEEETGVDILNNATMTQLKEHCYSTSLANTVISNRPYSSVEQYDSVVGVGPKSLWNLLTCYVQSGDWPPAAPDSVHAVLQGIPDNEWQLVTVDEAEVSSKSGKLFEICDPGTEHCIHVFSYSDLPDTLSVGDLVSVKGKVKWYSSGEFWELVISGDSGFVTILQEG